ncbi:MAG: hypothetical protein ABFE01_06330 [Phycisphaerales bacterium]|jgi:hypothetical protein
MEEAGNGRVHPPPFGRRMNDKWIAFKGKYKPGDELYFFRTNQRSWELTAGREGYVLLRCNQIVEMLFTGWS